MKFRVLILAALLISINACKNDTNSTAPPVTVAGQNPENPKNSPHFENSNTSGSEKKATTGSNSTDPSSDGLGEGTQEQQTMLIQAKTAFLANDYDTAEGFFRHLANSEPISGPTVTAALALGQIYTESDRKDEALSLYKSLVEDVPNVAEVQLVVARAYASVGESTAAMRAFEKTLELQPDFVFVHAELGNLFLQAGRNDDAAAAFLKYEQRVYAMASALENPETPDNERLQIVENFGLITDDRATEATVVALVDKHPQIRLTAAANLGELNVTAALGILEKMAVEDPDMQVRMTARASVNQLKKSPQDPSSTLAPRRVENVKDLPPAP